MWLYHNKHKTGTMRAGENVSNLFVEDEAKSPAEPSWQDASPPKPLKNQKSPAVEKNEIDTLARTLWGEARGEEVRGMEAVAAVVMNRVNADLWQDNKPDWWGEGVVAVCRKDWQFSCWNKDDPNREKMLALDSSDPIFQICKRIAAKAVRGALQDPTGGATHYHHEDLTPKWARGKTPTVQIGKHVFYDCAEGYRKPVKVKVEKWRL